MQVNNLGLHDRSPKTALRTVRLSKDVADTFERVAEEQGITFNALANKVMKRFAEFDQFAEKLSFVTLPHETVKSIMESIDEGRLEAMARRLGGRVPKEVTLYLYKESSFSSFLEYLEVVSKYYRAGAVDFTVKGRNMVVTIHHDMGRKWSSFLAVYLCQASRTIVDISPKYEIGDDLVVLRFKGPQLDQIQKLASDVGAEDLDNKLWRDEAVPD